jgi:hypothetical protein
MKTRPNGLIGAQGPSLAASRRHSFTCPITPKLVGIAPDQAARCFAVVDEQHVARPARQGLQPQRASSCKQVEHPRAIELQARHTHAPAG